MADPHTDFFEAVAQFSFTPLSYATRRFGKLQKLSMPLIGPPFLIYAPFSENFKGIALG
ncbi:MAG: hypothetical protein V4586_15730 [Pseudomonadota bacterium]